MDKLAHFDRERIPPRVVHAKGAAAHGYFEVLDDFSALCKAKFLNRVGKRTPIFARFSTMLGERGSSDTLRDVRGFALKFYTEEGNWDLVGSNMPAFYIRDPILFPDLIHSLKKNPRTNTFDHDAYWGFLGQVPESIHQIAHLFSDRGLPDGYTHMHGYGGHTFKFVSPKNEVRFVKFHFKSDQGIKNLSDAEGSRLAGTDPDYASNDLASRISNAKFPSWTVFIQVMEPEDATTYKWNVFDITKVWHHNAVPLRRIGRIVLNRNPTDYFSEVEQSAFSPSCLVPGIESSWDKVLQGRLFSCADSARYRLGANYMQIPINAPYSTRVSNDYRDGSMNIKNQSGVVPRVVTPSIKPTYQFVHPSHPGEEDHAQAGIFWKSVLSEDEKIRLVSRLVQSLSKTKKAVREPILVMISRADTDWADRVRSGLSAKSSSL